MANYAVGKHAFGFCDICGFRYPLKELRSEVINRARVNILACPECWSPDQPQNHLGEVRVSGPQILRNPRPPLGLQASRWGEGGEYGKTVWNFRDGTDNWFGLNYAAESANTFTWNESKRTVSLTQTQSGKLSVGYWENPNFSGSKYTSIDASTFKVMRMRIMLDSTEDDIGTWDSSNQSGWMLWTYDTASLASPDFDKHEPCGAKSPGSSTLAGVEPDWDEAMGDRFVTMKWDMSDNPDWTGTVTGFLIHLYNNTDSDNYKTYEIDSIRIGEN